MNNELFFPGGRVRVTGYSPFRGLEGKILRIDPIADDLEESFCFSLIALEGTTTEEPIWFEDQELELIGFPPLRTFQPQIELAYRELAKV